MNKCKVIKQNIKFSRTSIIKEVVNKESKTAMNLIPAFEIGYKAVVIIVACIDLQITTATTATIFWSKMDDILHRNVSTYSQLTDF